MGTVGHRSASRFIYKTPLFPSPIAFHAIVMSFFAFAAIGDLGESSPAFQASSPKNFQAGLRIGLFFVRAPV
jgi:hypothetical protein